MPNIWNADCGFNLNQKDKFEDLTVEVINNPEGVDLTGHKNMHISLASESSDVSIEDFECMVPGMEYTIVAANGANTKNELIFPSASTLYSGEITKANGMTVVYKFFTDRYSIYCDRRIYQ
mgnify:CR=1 FL=1